LPWMRPDVLEAQGRPVDQYFEQPPESARSAQQVVDLMRVTEASAFPAVRDDWLLCRYPSVRGPAGGSREVETLSSHLGSPLRSIEDPFQIDTRMGATSNVPRVGNSPAREWMMDVDASSRTVDGEVLRPVRTAV